MLKRLGVLLVCVGAVAIALHATAADPASDRAAYARKATWPESMAATRTAYIQWLHQTGREVKPSGFRPYDSGSMPGDGPARRVVVDVSGLDAIRLISLCEQGTANCNIWGEPTLFAKDGSQTRLGSLAPTSIVVGWGQLLTDKNWQDRPLHVGDKTFSHGLWVHANSEVTYALGGKYERFEAWVGEDKDRANGSLRFRV
ncbi:MAG: NPCBM/NEW2 domain-containing protein, partial [Planctomycetes bacterium]|nr:NPCBM/NEW2 domain-containing protein [Planctomycetota bacterium]